MLSDNTIYFYKETHPVPNWDISSHRVGQDYIPYATAKNGMTGGRHVMDDFGDLRQALPKDHYLEQYSREATQYAYWGPYGVDDTYFYH